MYSFITIPLMVLKETETLPIRTWSVSPSYKKQHKKPTEQETLRRISCIFHQLLYLFTPPIHTVQTPNACTGDTNWDLLFDPCRLQSIESHVIWKLNPWGSRACEWDCKFQVYWQGLNPLAQLYHFSWNNMNIDIWQWMHCWQGEWDISWNEGNLIIKPLIL